MNTTGKWLIRAGSLLIMLGFVLPFMSVSCSAAPGLGQSFSLMTLTGFANQFILYLVPIGALAAIVLSVLPSINQATISGFFWGQVIGIVAGIISVFITVISLNNQIGRLMAFTTSPEIGVFVLLGGYILSIAGLVKQWLELSKKQPSIGPPQGSVDKPLLNIPPPIINRIPGSIPSNPRLQGIQGSFTNSTVRITRDNFTVGRSADNDLQLHDMKVSRQHASLRYAQGVWFIQDRESAGGLWVNDQPVHATRLNPGDRITIGDETFIFYE
jgi:hypothetical protein